MCIRQYPQYTPTPFINKDKMAPAENSVQNNIDFVQFLLIH
jgi:hypothetical protein